MKKIAFILTCIFIISAFSSCSRVCKCSIDNGTDIYSYTTTYDGKCEELNQTTSAKANNNPSNPTATRRICVEE